MEIKFKDVSYIYDKVNYETKEILKNISLTFLDGKITGIVGESGSGKTTLVELIDALILPSSGHIQVGDFTIENNKKIKNINELRFQVGLVFQFPEEQIFGSTVKEELELGLKFYQYKLNHLENRVKDVLKMVGLHESDLHKKISALSHGEKRKVVIASMLIMNPKVLILDEPTIGLDPESKNSMLQLLRMLKNRYHKTILIVSHDTNFLLPIVDEIVVLHDKQVVLKGDKYTVFKERKKLKQYGVEIPKLIAFSDLVLQKKNIRLGYRDEIKDLMKDIYRHVK